MPAPSAIAAAGPGRLDLSDLGSIAVVVTDRWELWAWAAGTVAAAIVVGLVVHAVVFAVLIRVAARTTWRFDEVFFAGLKRPSRLLFPLLAVQVVLPNIAGLSGAALGVIRHIVGLATIAAAGWLAIAVVHGLGDIIRRRYDVTVADNLEARRVHTQITVLARTIVVFTVILTAAVALMTFPRIRELGASLLVSAGFAGLAIGLAARPVLENLIAGVQLALTQPIRLDDVVIVDGEWGRIEEITTTYVVVKVWDERRLIVPFSKFITDSFQNWTRTSAAVLGTVFVHTDYTVPVDRVREELRRIVSAHDDWDERVCNVQVTDLTERSVQLRALVSASDASRAWDLRVHVRERLLDFLQREYPASLPRTRVDLAGAAAPGPSTGPDDVAEGRRGRPS